MRNIQQTKKVKTPKVAIILGATLITLVYALNSLPGGFFCIILFLTVIIMVLATLSIFFKNLRKNLFESVIALVTLFIAGYVFFKASPSEMYRSKIVIVAKSDDSKKTSIAFRDNGLISVTPKSLNSIFFNTEAFYELKDDTLIITKKPHDKLHLFADTSIIKKDKIISISKASQIKDNSKYKDLQIIEDNRK